MIITCYCEFVRKKEETYTRLNKNVFKCKQWPRQHDGREQHARDTIAVVRTITKQKIVYKALDNRKYIQYNIVVVICTIKTFIGVAFFAVVAFAIFTTMTLNAQLLEMCADRTELNKRTNEKSK